MREADPFRFYFVLLLFLSSTTFFFDLRLLALLLLLLLLRHKPPHIGYTLHPPSILHLVLEHRSPRQTSLRLCLPFAYSVVVVVVRRRRRHRLRRHHHRIINPPHLNPYRRPKNSKNRIHYLITSLPHT